jgi:chorismate dehydratase
MSMTFKIASVSFLNARPLIDRFDPEDQARVDLCGALPSRLGAMLAEGTADVGLLPVVEMFRGRSGGMIPGIGIACEGAVDSVKLFHRGDLAKITKVAADRGSRSSVALLKVLFLEKFGTSPAFTEVEPSSDLELPPGTGALIIGDRCLEFERDRGAADDAPEAWDLGAAWHELTGLPFVFAVWAVAPGFPEKVGPLGVEDLTGILTRARDRGLAGLDEIVAEAATSGRLGRGGEATVEALDYYFRQSLRYILGEGEMAGLRRFHELCIRHGLVPAGAAPSILEGQA